MAVTEAMITDLRLIEELATQIASRAAQLESPIRSLPARPTWVTKAEAQLQQADAELSRAIRLIRQARDHYTHLPTVADLVAAE